MITLSDDLLMLVIPRDEALLLAAKFESFFIHSRLSDSDVARYWPEVHEIVKLLKKGAKTAQPGGER